MKLRKKLSMKTWLFIEIYRRIPGKLRVVHECLHAYEQCVIEGNALISLYNVQDFIFGVYAAQGVSRKNFLEIQELIRREIYNRTPHSPAQFEVKNRRKQK